MKSKIRTPLRGPPAFGAGAGVEYRLMCLAKGGFRAKRYLLEPVAIRDRNDGNSATSAIAVLAAACNDMATRSPLRSRSTTSGSINYCGLSRSLRNINVFPM